MPLFYRQVKFHLLLIFGLNMLLLNYQSCFLHEYFSISKYESILCALLNSQSYVLGFNT